MLDDFSLLSRLQSSGLSFSRDVRGGGTLILAAVVFLLVAGIGAVISYVGILARPLALVT